MSMLLPPPLWLSERFGFYYSHSQPPSLPYIERREFGFGGWEKKIEFRHMAFRSGEELKLRLAKDRPLYVSASSAYYEFPSARPMARKNWLGADLVFDLDAKPHECAPFTCEKCIHHVRDNAIRLIEDFLIADFGLSRKEIMVSFSGSRGFHIRVFKKELESLGREERREILDYIEGVGIEFEGMFAKEPVLGRKNMHRIIGPTPSTWGYGGYFARRVVEIASSQDGAAKISSKLKKKEVAQKFIEGINAGRWSDVQIPNAMEVFKKLFEELKLSVSNRVEADANVTIDVTKILRMPDTIHGGSGLLAKTISAGIDLGSFEPMHSALAFSMDKVESIKAICNIPQISFGNQTFDAIQKDKVIALPQAYAIYLVCKKAAIPQ